MKMLLVEFDVGGMGGGRETDSATRVKDLEEVKTCPVPCTVSGPHIIAWH